LTDLDGARRYYPAFGGRADKLANAHSELVDAPIGLDTTLSKSNHRPIDAFDVAG
jgi:hypothetical protein